MPPTLVLVDLAASRLRVWRDGLAVHECPVSCGEAGAGCEAGSGRTPWGWHRVHSVVGRGESLGARFVSREPTGEIWDGTPIDEDWILTRILRLEGLEPGVNRGPGVDSFERYIYIHGTPREDLLGRPASHGCVRVSNRDAEILAELAPEGTPVFLGPRGAP